MPTPRRTSVEEIVQAARRILEAEGLENLTMESVAKAVGVRAPSLYKHVQSRGDLLRLIGNDAMQELGARSTSAGGSGDSRRDLEQMARVQRAFAREFPETYRLLWAPLPADWRVDAELTARAFEPLYRAAAAVAGEAGKLAAARTMVSWVHGFVSMELAGTFPQEDDVDVLFDYDVDRMTRALMPVNAPSRTRAGTPKARTAAPPAKSRLRR
jgi:AcrR family transcriptional regulator